MQSCLFLLIKRNKSCKIATILVQIEFMKFPVPKCLATGWTTVNYYPRIWCLVFSAGDVSSTHERGDSSDHDLVALPLCLMTAHDITETVWIFQNFTCTKKPLTTFQNRLEDNSPMNLSLFIPVASKSLTKNKAYGMLVEDLFCLMVFR